MDKSPDAFRTISEAAEELTVPQHVLRFWETRFTQIKPMKRAGGRRYYRPTDIELLKGIHTLLYNQGYTIRGVQRILKEEGGAYVVGIGKGEVMPRKGDAAREGAPPPGTAKVAPVMIGSVNIGNITVRNIQGAVAERGKLHRTLLGMTFLSKLNVEMRKNVLVLRQ